MNVDFKFYGITSRGRMTPVAFIDHLQGTVKAGVRAIQVREKDLTPRELWSLCRDIKALAEKTGTLVFVNDRIDILLSLDLDGIHLTESSLPVADVRRIIGTTKWIGASTHDRSGAIAAASAGADFVVCGPVAPTPSKPAGHAILSEAAFRQICQDVPVPVFALGGVQTENITQWLEAGAHGVAGISLLMDPHDIVGRMERIKKKLGHL